MYYSCVHTCYQRVNTAVAVERTRDAVLTQHVCTRCAMYIRYVWYRRMHLYRGYRAYTLLGGYLRIPRTVCISAQQRVA